MKKRYLLLIFSIFCLFTCINEITASEIYCYPDYTLYTDSSGNQKCKKSTGNPFKEFNQWHCSPGDTLIDDTCYSIKDPLVDGCESGYELYTNSSGTKKCKKKIDSVGQAKLIETFCQNNSSCTYLKSPNAAEMKCESGYEMYTDSNGNQKCKKKVGIAFKDVGVWICASGTKIGQDCYSIKDPLKDEGGCDSGYELYTNSSNNQMCKKKLNDSEVITLMENVCSSESDECEYIKDVIENENVDPDPTPDPTPDIDISTPIDGNHATENDFLGNLTCGGTQFRFHRSLPNFTATMYDLLKIVTPIIIVIMGMVDMIKAVSAQKEDEIKKGQQKLLRRFIAGVIVFLVFVIVEAVINMFAEGDDANNAMDCVNCFLGGANNCGKFYSSIGQETYEPDDVGCWECTATDNISGYKVYYYGKYKDAFESNSYIYECKKSNRTQNKCTN